MSSSASPERLYLGLLPEPERSASSFVISSFINLTILGVAIYIGITARQVIVQHYEQTELIVPNTPPPEQVKPPRIPPPKVKPPEEKTQPRQIEMPKPEPKPIQMQARLITPEVQQSKPVIKLAPQLKPALASAMPAITNQPHPAVAPVHLGDLYGATPNPNAARPATIAAIGNPYGGQQGAAVAPRGVVGSTGIGYSAQQGSGSGTGVTGKVASVGMPGTTTAVAPAMTPAPMQSTSVEILSKPPAQYTAEARQLRIEGDVVLSVTFLANGQVEVHGVQRGLGHGLDQEAIRVAQQIRFRPATSNGRPIDLTTHITISFQLA
jgi:TonB family protein